MTTHKNQVGQGGTGVNGGEFAKKVQTETAAQVSDRLQREARAAERRVHLFSAQTLAVSIIDKVPTAASIDMWREINDTWVASRVANIDGEVIGEFEENVLVLNDGTEIEFDEDIEDLMYNIPEERPTMSTTGPNGQRIFGSDPGYNWLTVDGDNGTIDLGLAYMTRHDGQAEVTLGTKHVALYDPLTGEFEFQN